MLRRLNSTGRKRIEAGMVSISLLTDSEPPAFATTLALDGLELPEAAKVIVEAQRLSVAERFDLGPLSDITPGRRSELSELAADDALQFRVKVVEPKTGRLLAVRRRIKPGDMEEGGRLPILTVEERDLGAEPWRTEFTSDEAVLVLNAKIPDAIAKLKTRGTFQALILPAAFRQILLRLWAERQEGEDDDDPDRWQARWLRFATTLTGGEPDWAAGASADWIDEACAKFAERHQVIDPLTGCV